MVLVLKFACATFELLLYVQPSCWLCLCNLRVGFICATIELFLSVQLSCCFYLCNLRVAFVLNKHLPLYYHMTAEDTCARKKLRKNVSPLPCARFLGVKRDTSECCEWRVLSALRKNVSHLPSTWRSPPSEDDCSDGKRCIRACWRQRSIIVARCLSRECYHLGGEKCLPSFLAFIVRTS